MDFIRGNEVKEALKSTYRVYLCGNLQKPQQLKWISDNKNEIGTSYYKEFTADQPHFHTTATEYNYVLSGYSKVLLIDEDKEYIFDEGSLFVISPMTKYASKHSENTKILFLKTPVGNDKQLVDVNEQLEKWLRSW